MFYVQTPGETKANKTAIKWTSSAHVTKWYYRNYVVCVLCLSLGKCALGSRLNE
jgi:hypothetical protein